MKKESVYFFWEKEGKRSGSQGRLNVKTERFREEKVEGKPVSILQEVRASRHLLSILQEYVGCLIRKIW